MKYLTLALMMAVPCLAQASQDVTGILSTDSYGTHSLQEIAADLTNCKTIEDIQANLTECLTHRTIYVSVPTSGDNDQAGAHDALEAQLQSSSGSLVRLTGKVGSIFAGGRVVFFDLSLNDPIQIIASPQTPEPCPNYNGVCKPQQPQPAPVPCGNYNGVCH